jgi:glycosyltransferase involved in cell wall biosynthesis
MSVRNPFHAVAGRQKLPKRGHEASLGQLTASAHRSWRTGTRSMAGVTSMSVSAQPRATNPRLSILIVSFNHASFIRRSLEGLLMQDFRSGRVEVVVADDKSTDRTLEIIHEMLDDVPWLTVRYLDADANLGITRNYQRGFGACRGDYVAVLEGDDYWTFPGKLRRQVAFLDAHRECPACTTNCLIHRDEQSSFDLRLPQTTGYQLVDARQQVISNIPGNFSTYVYRQEALQRLPEDIFELVAYDWLVNICIARSGPIGVLNRPMSVYYIHANGAWSKLSEVEKMRQQLSVIEAYDAFTDHVFHAQFSTVAQSIRAYLRTNTQHRWSNPTHVLAVFRAFFPPIILKLVPLLVPPAVPILLRKITAYATWKRQKPHQP